MQRIFTRKLPLRASIVALFALLTVPLFFTMIAVTYVSNERIARSTADNLVARFRLDAVAGVENLFSPIRAQIHTASALGGEQPGFYAGNASLGYLYSILVHNPRLVGVYVGLADGSFRQARRINPALPVAGKPPPRGVEYAYRWIVPNPGSPLVDRYLFLDGDKRPLGSTEQRTSYDPRARYWYRKAAEKGALLVTDPGVFAVFGLSGVTVAAPFYRQGKLAGVVAADLTLDGLSRSLAQRKISPGTQSYILDAEGRIIANSERTKTYSSKSGQVQLLHIASLADPLPGIAYGSRPRGSARSYSFSYAGQRYVASLSRLPANFGKQWQLFTVTPLHDFTRRFETHDERLLVLGVVAILFAILVIYFLSRALSAPLERLARKVGAIRDIALASQPPVVSPIREISVLSRAIDTLDAAVKSFAAFVPVGLVKQLVESEQKLELGGHSRFLTIFFCDLEAFSTLSEELPTQDLLRRVSAYLEIVTRAVNAEAGTIDKFIGDGVMAFWGAPALLEEHAWHACLAALAIREGMAELNRGWQADGVRPLNIRIGIHSDAVLVGNIGCAERMGYTVIGDGVNVASRLEGINKEYGTRLCISHSVYKEAGERLCVRPIDEVTVKGRRGRIPIYELVGAFGADPRFVPDAAAMRLCALTRHAHEALVQEDFMLALERYQEVLTEFPEDPVSLALTRRLRADPVQQMPTEVAS